MIEQLRKGADMARGDDSNKLKTACVEWINAHFGASEPRLRTHSKHERGFETDNTGRLLCPGEYNWDDAE